MRSCAMVGAVALTSCSFEQTCSLLRVTKPTRLFKESVVEQPLWELRGYLFPCSAFWDVYHSELVCDLSGVCSLEA